VPGIITFPLGVIISCGGVWAMLLTGAKPSNVIKNTDATRCFIVFPPEYNFECTGGQKNASVCFDF